MTTLQTLGSLFPLGDRDYFATVNRFNGELKIHIRKYFEPKPIPGEAPPLLPTKYGVALNPKEFIELQTILPYLNDIVEQNQVDLKEPQVDQVKWRKNDNSKRMKMSTPQKEH